MKTTFGTCLVLGLGVIVEVQVVVVVAAWMFVPFLHVELAVL